MSAPVPSYDRKHSVAVLYTHFVSLSTETSRQKNGIMYFMRMTNITPNFRFILGLSIMLVGGMVLVPTAQAAVVTWDGGGSTNNWSDGTNWSTNSVPASTDSVVFDSTSTKNATIDSSFGDTISAVSMNAGYTGIITQARSFTVTNALTATAGTYQASADALVMGDLTVNGGTVNHSSGPFTIGKSNCSANNFTVSSGTFSGGSGSITVTTTCDDAVAVSGGTLTSTSGTLSALDLEWTAGTFTHNSGTVELTGGASTLNLPSSGTLNNVTLNKSDGATQTLATSDALTVAGTLTLSNGKLSTATAITVQGNLTYNAGYDGVGASKVTFTVNGSGTQAIDYSAASGSIEGFTINNSSATVTGIASGSVTLKKATLQNGTWNLGNGNSTVTEGIYISGGTMNHGSGSLIIADDTCSADRDFSTTGGSFVGGSGDITWNGNCGGHTFDLSGTGAFTSTSGTFTIDYDVSITGGTFTHNSGTILIDGAASALNVDTSLTTNHLTINKNNAATLTLGTGDTIVAAGTITLTNGLFSSGTLLDAQGSVTIASTWDSGTTPLRFSGSGTQTFTLTGAEGLFNNDITVNKSGGAVNLASALTMDATSQDLTIQEGTFDLSGYALTVNGGSATLIVETGGVLRLQGGESITANTNYPQIDSGSTVYYDGTSGPYTLKDYTYHHLTVDGANTLFTLAANESVAGDVTITNGTLSQGGFTLSVSGTFSNQGTLRRFQTETFTGTMDVDSGTVEYVGDNDGSAETVTITDFGGASTDYYHLQISDTSATPDTFTIGAGLTAGGTVTVSNGTFTQGANVITAAALTVDGGTLTGGSSAFNVNGVVVVSAGTFTSTSDTLTVQGGWTHTAGGTFNHNSGTVTFTSGAATLDVSTSETFNNVTINKTDGVTLTITSGDTLLVAASLSLTNGAVGTGTLEAQGSVTVASTFDGGNATLRFSGGTNQTFTLTGAEALYDGPMVVAKSSNTVSLASALTLNANSDFTLTSGTFSANGYDLTTTGSVSANGGTFTGGSGAVSVTGSLTIAGATFTSTSGTLSVGGNLSLTSGSFTHNSGSVVMNGSAQQIVGTFTFNNFTKTTSSATSLTFPASVTTTVAGTLTLQGASGQLLTIQSSVSGTPASLDAQGSRSVQYLSVQDSTVVSTLRIRCWTGCVSVSNNSNWSFAAGSVTLTESGGTTAVTEGGATDTYSLVLTDQPTSDVTITTSPNSQITASVTTLTFTSSNWATAQNVTVTAVNDSVAEGTHTGSITHTSSSSDSTFHQLTLSSVTPSISDNDTAGFSVSSISTNLTEVGGTATATVVLTSQPSADVTIAVSSSDTTEGTVSPSSLIFTSANWNTSQTLTVTGVNDAVDDGNVSFSIVLASAVSSDANYNNSNPSDVSVQTLDDDTAGVTLTQTGTGTNVSEAGTTDTYSFVLNSQPTQTVTLSASPDSQLSVSPSSLTFTSSNWNTAQTITVSAVRDTLIEGSHTGTITHTASSTDSSYNQISLDAVTVTITDNQSPVFSGELSNVSFTAGTSTETVFDLDEYFSDADGDVLTLTVVNASQVTVTIAQDNAVSFSAAEDISTEETIYFVATDPYNATAQSNELKVVVSAVAEEIDIDHLTGAPSGPGVIKVYDEDNNLVAEWTAFAEGGVIPKIGEVKGTTYIFAVKHTSGTTMHVYSTSGELLTVKRLSPRLHVRKLSLGNLNRSKSTSEIVVGALRGTTLYLKVFSFTPRGLDFVLLEQAVVKHIKRDYRIVIRNKRIVVILNGSGKEVFVWKPF